MFRIMSIATLAMIIICFFIGAGLAFADDGQPNASPAPGAEQVNDASRPVDDYFVENLARRDRDEYDFSDYTAGPAITPAIDAESIEEPGLDRMLTIGI